MSTSLGERLLAARSKKQAAHEEVFEVPGYGGQLFARYRPLDFREARRIGQRHEALRDEVEKELRVAADTLASACISCEAHIDGEVKELPPLGLKLCEDIGLDGPETPIQAVLEIFPSEMSVVRQFVELQGAEETSNGAIDGELENSQAAMGS
jgi:hypothetical protein